MLEAGQEWGAPREADRLSVELDVFGGAGLQLQPAAGAQVLQTAGGLQTAHAEATRWDCSNRIGGHPRGEFVRAGRGVEVRYFQEEPSGGVVH